MPFCRVRHVLYVPMRRAAMTIADGMRIVDRVKIAVDATVVDVMIVVAGTKAVVMAAMWAAGLSMSKLPRRLLPSTRRA